MLGRDVVVAAQDAGHEVTACTRGDLDITDRDAISRAVARARPELVINCAAYTDVDGAEQDRASAVAVNASAPGHVAQAAADHEAWLIHISTDYVFDGAKRQPYVESDRPAPLSVYGASKLDGERAVAAGAPHRHTIIRTSWLFGTHGHCFPATIRRLAAERDRLTVVDDQVGCPTFTAHLAWALMQIAENPPLGVVHVAGDGHCSWFEFARATVRAADQTCEIKPGRTQDLGRPASRPAYSVLGTARREAPRLPGWEAGLAEFIAAGVPVS
jgi:dTDP-4-dehydrorhamnose reductase